MIRNQWYPILGSKEVRRGKPISVLRLGENMVLWRDAQGKVVAMKDKCPHRGAALSAGDLVENRVRCPFHGLQFDSSGRCTIIPSNGASTPVPKAFQMTPYPTQEAHGLIWLWWGLPRPDLPPVRFFDALDESFSYIAFQDHWKTHYGRAIENQLDAMHLPFVHRTTIGAGNRTIIDGPVSAFSEDDPDLLNVWISMRSEDGKPARRARQMAQPTGRPMLQFRFPNIWHNWISSSTRIFIAFVPVDAENTKMYIRYYQRMVTIPVVRELVNLSGLIGSFIIERQDKRVVETQRPYAPGLRIGEQLVPGDGPIIAYRRRRERLMQAARDS